MQELDTKQVLFDNHLIRNQLITRLHASMGDDVDPKKIRLLNELLSASDTQILALARIDADKEIAADQSSASILVGEILTRLLPQQVIKNQQGQKRLSSFSEGEVIDIEIEDTEMEDEVSQVTYQDFISKMS